jgi:hypothetical protein
VKRIRGEQNTGICYRNRLAKVYMWIGTSRFVFLMAHRSKVILRTNEKLPVVQRGRYRNGRVDAPDEGFDKRAQSLSGKLIAKVVML